MSKSFKEAAALPTTSYTLNGMPTLTSSGNALVDLFSAIGSSRGKDLVPQFDSAYESDRVKALKILLWARDIRGGSGERQTPRNLLVHLEQTHPEDVEMLLPYIPFFGRWDDLFIFRTKEMRQKAYSIIAEALTDNATKSLVAKWCPRKDKIALELEEFLGLQPKASNFKYSEGKKAYPGKAYRQLLSTLSNTVEQKMSAKEWEAINFGHVPSLAAARYQKAFNRRCAERYKEYKESLSKGIAKVNAAAVYPYDVIKSIGHGDAAVAKAQWETLPNFLGDENILAMVDVSGSMLSAAGNSKISNLDIAVSLGLYIADKAKSAFKDCFMTFSGSPKIEVLKGDIVAKCQQMKTAHWGMNTNIMAAFYEILRVGKDNSVSDTDMPKMLLILSDMEFDYCVHKPERRAIERLRELYEEAGYTFPRVVFWNLASRPGNSPVSFRENSTALVSGFSPAIMKSILKAQKLEAKNFTPETVMEETINNPRYDVIDIIPKPKQTEVSLKISKSSGKPIELI